MIVGVCKNRGTPKWMVKIMENPIKVDELGVPLFLETPTFSNLVISKAPGGQLSSSCHFFQEICCISSLVTTIHYHNNESTSDLAFHKQLISLVDAVRSSQKKQTYSLAL